MSLQIRELLLGAPLNDRTPACLFEHINSHLEALVELIKNVYTRSEARDQAILEITRVVEMKNTPAALVCKRALFLCSLHKEETVHQFWKDTESFATAEDLALRVVPFLMPRFLSESCQNPHAFVTSCVLMSEMWREERLGNFPRH